MQEKIVLSPLRGKMTGSESRAKIIEDKTKQDMIQ